MIFAVKSDPETVSVCVAEVVPKQIVIGLSVPVTVIDGVNGIKFCEIEKNELLPAEDR